jgi:rubrerythrin
MGDRHISTVQEGIMSNSESASLDMFCTAVEMKEKKKALYEDAMKSCPDQVGIETFRMLVNAEDEHLKSLQAAYEELKKGKIGPDTCKFHAFESADKKTLLRKVAKEHGKLPKACLDDVVAIETGMNLENATIEFFEKELKRATDPVERALLERMISEEREHFVLLADLKLYYVDTENWMMEKGGWRLDGAGGAA